VGTGVNIGQSGVSIAPFRSLVFAQVSGIETDYGDLADLLDRNGAPLPAAELHGGLCGVLCASGRDAGAQWLDSLLDDCSGDLESLSRLGSSLDSLGTETWVAFNSLSLDFVPLLPDDDSAIEQRAEALGHWCHGFLAGLVVGGIDLSGAAEPLSAEVQELVRDFAEISRVGADVDEAGDSEIGDGALIELIEFVRVGAQFIFEELINNDAASRRIH